MATASASRPCSTASRPSSTSAASGATPSGGGTLPVEDPATGETLVEVADASASTTRSPRWRAAADIQPSGRAPGPRERGEILRRALELITERVDDLALLMTLEMGKPVAESKAEITYAAEFLRWFAEEAVRIDGRYTVNADRQGPRADHAPAGRARACSSRRGTSRWPWARARSARRSPPAARWWSSPRSRRRCRCSRWPQILEEAGLPGGVLNVITATSSGDGDGAADRGPAHAQAVVHRLDRGGPHADRAGGRAGPARVDGAGRQRAVPGLRGRRPRRGASRAR